MPPRKRGSSSGTGRAADAGAEEEEPAAAMPDVAKIGRMTVTELKKELTRHGLETDGLKAVLAQRLTAFMRRSIFPARGANRRAQCP